MDLVLSMIQLRNYIKFKENDNIILPINFIRVNTTINFQVSEE
jgi:hypothetical protein